MIPEISHVLLSRIQFSVTAMFHILWPVLIIGLSLYLVGMQAAWHRTGDRSFYQQARFWQKLFFLALAMGVISGIPLEFQFGTNWSVFSRVGGDIFGHMLGFEAAMAFMLEATFLGIMAYGWNRVSSRTHLFATAVVAFGASLSAFWIMVANSWMQTPRGGEFVNGRFVMTDTLQAVFNPDIVWSFSHMWFACLEITVFVVGGISAWNLLRGRSTRFFLRSFKIAAAAAVVVAPMQVFLGDGAGRMIHETQPAKLAAIEAHWQTNPPGEGADWKILAWPDPERERNAWALEVPDGLSLLLTHSPTGKVRGLREIPPENRPPVWLPYYSFRVMIGIGFGLVLLMGWTAYAWYRGRLREAAVAAQGGLLRAWIVALPLSFLAMEAGWITREVGRQPWIIYGVLRTEEATSVLPAGAVWTSLLAISGVYAALFAVFLWLAGRIVAAGPEADA